MSVVEPVDGAVGSAYQVRSILAEKPTRSAVERHRKVPTHVAVRDHCAPFVAKQERDERPPLLIAAEIHRAHDSRNELVLAADPYLHADQSPPGRA